MLNSSGKRPVYIIGSDACEERSTLSMDNTVTAFKLSSDLFRKGWFGES